MTDDFYDKLVDLYAAGELTDELQEMMDKRGFADPALALEMGSLREAVRMLRGEPAPEFTEESHQRILMKIYARGGDIQMQSPDPAHLQYHLPIQG